MKREAVIRLTCELRDDGSIYVRSPDVPMFHVVGADAPHAQELAFSILKEHLELNYDLRVELRPIESLESLIERHQTVSRIPAHVIAEMTA